VRVSALVIALCGITSAAAAQLRSVADSALRARADSIARADSVFTQLPRTELPVLTEVGFSHRWNRDSLFSAGALTVADLLERVPGFVSLRARFYMAGQLPAYNGDVGRVRLFLDGVELEPLDPRSGGVTDLSQFPLAALEELAVERGANELRVLMRSWRGPLRTTAQTRADVLTGDNRSNTFRGFLARRTKSGFAFQAMLQQRSTEDRRLGGDGDATTAFTRVAWIQPKWSLDATLLRVRSAQQSLTVFSRPDFLAIARDIPRYDNTQRDITLRLGVGDVTHGAWLQLISAFRRNDEQSPRRSTADAARRFAADTTDTLSTSTQYVAAAGWTSQRARFSATHRVRLVNGATLQHPSARVGFDFGRLAVSGFAERNPLDDVVRADALVRVQPLPRLAFSGALSVGSSGTARIAPDSTGANATVPLPPARALRAEAALRVGRLWVQGGGIVRDSMTLRAPSLIDPSLRPIGEGRAVGATYSIAGPLFKGLSLHVKGTRWENIGWYRPQTEVRSELTWRYHWVGATPGGGFVFVLAGDAEYRSRINVPRRLSNGTVVPVQSNGAAPLGLRAELTIKDATIMAQFRNVLATQYTTLPGLLMPGPLTVYGIRWTFWN
jgi:hypothetical protein